MNTVDTVQEVTDPAVLRRAELTKSGALSADRLRSEFYVALVAAANKKAFTRQQINDFDALLATIGEDEIPSMEMLMTLAEALGIKYSDTFEIRVKAY